MGKFQLRSLTRQRYGVPLKLPGSSSSKKMGLAKAYDFVNRGAHGESNI